MNHEQVKKQIDLWTKKETSLQKLIFVMDVQRMLNNMFKQIEIEKNEKEVL